MATDEQPKLKVYERTITVFIVAATDEAADEQIEDAWCHLAECSAYQFHSIKEAAEEELKEQQQEAAEE